MKVVERGAEVLGVNDEDKVSRQAVVENKEIDESPERAVFSIRGARKRAGNWITTIKQDLEMRFKQVEVLQTQVADEAGKKDVVEKKAEKKAEKKVQKAEKRNVFDKMGRGLENIHPLNVMNEGLKDKLKETAMNNRRKIAALLVEASIYCCVFEGVKRGLQKTTKHRKYTGPVVKFATDVALPNGLYGPIFGFLVRLTLPF